jgi:hypothetical protein
VASGTKGTNGLSLVEEDCGLAFPDNQLGPEFDFTGAFFRQTVNQFLSSVVKPLQYFKINQVVGSHENASLRFLPRS